jgi:hypothetical protein
MPETSAAHPLGITAEDPIRFRLDELIAYNRRLMLRVFFAGLIAASIPAVVLGMWLGGRLEGIDDEILYLQRGAEEIDGQMDMILFRECGATD